MTCSSHDLAGDGRSEGLLPTCCQQREPRSALEDGVASYGGQPARDCLARSGDLLADCRQSRTPEAVAWRLGRQPLNAAWRSSAEKQL
jgi:hypothetical protein